ncbi:hypothetical protein FKN04_05235 [Bacillus glycinifermentans]|uniref:Uncharacterized protein n=1 Tax=Bacillus glycinifermentans TaxID=1664069 RepID=A0AAJ3Z2A2_9BACI|nr:hypothetical protein [Bacillus glycinifermentans]QAT66245.1 hypothetical protein EQZ20_15955 [Bacillus glycinifermentans]
MKWKNRKQRTGTHGSLFFSWSEKRHPFFRKTVYKQEFDGYTYKVNKKQRRLMNMKNAMTTYTRLCEYHDSFNLWEKLCSSLTDAFSAH